MRAPAHPLRLDAHRHPLRRGRIEIGIHAFEKQQVILKIFDDQPQARLAAPAGQDADRIFFDDEFRRTQRPAVALGNRIGEKSRRLNRADQGSARAEREQAGRRRLRGQAGAGDAPAGEIAAAEIGKGRSGFFRGFRLAFAQLAPGPGEILRLRQIAQCLERIFEFLRVLRLFHLAAQGGGERGGFEFALPAGGERGAQFVFQLRQRGVRRSQLFRIVEDAEGRPRAREDAVKRVEILVGNRIEFMVVAAGALDGQAEESFAQRLDLPVDDRGLLALHIDGRGVAFDHPMPRRAEPGLVEAERAIPARREQIAGDLLLHEAIVGQVGVEGADEVVAVAPGVRIEVVVLGAVSLGVAREVHPVPRPAFAEGGGGEEAVREICEL